MQRDRATVSVSQLSMHQEADKGTTTTESSYHQGLDVPRLSHD